MKVVISILGSLAIVAVAFIGGMVASELTGFGQSNGIVKIRNNSGVDLRSVDVEVDTCGHTGVISAGALASGGTVEVRYEICSEGGQTIRATFSDGKVIVSEQEYVESGYRATAEVSTNGIT
jgi:hypothetical protein